MAAQEGGFALQQDCSEPMFPGKMGLAQPHQAESERHLETSTMHAGCLKRLAKQRRWACTVALGSCLSVVSGAALIETSAQELPSPSGAIERFERDQRLRDALDEQNRQLLKQRKELVSPEKKPQGPELPLDQTPAFQYDSVRFVGVSVERESKLQALAKPYLNRPISLQDLETLRRAIRDDYRTSNLLAVVTIDPSGPKGGVLVISVVESRLGDVKIDPQVRHHLNDGIAKAMVTASVPIGSLIRLDKLTSALLKINDMAGVSVRSTLERGSKEGTTDVLLTIRDKDRTSGLLNINNEINRFLGELDTNLTLTGSNLLGRGEQISIQGAWWGSDIGTGNLMGSLNASLPVTPDGGQLTLYGNYNNYRLLKELYTTDVNGSSSNIRLGFQQPLWRRPLKSLWASISAENNTYIDNIQTFEIRDKDSQVARLSFLGQLQDQFLGTGLNTAYFQYSLGNLDRAGNDNDLFIDGLTAQTNGTFNKLSLIFSRYQIFSDRWQAKIFIQSQKAFNNLDGAEKLSLGYPNGVRAYPPGEAPGDSGVSGQFEFIYRAAPKLSFVAFLDGGYIWRWTNPFPGSLQPNAYGLAGTGIGVDVGISGEWLLSAKLAFPIGTNPASINDTDADGLNQGMRVWASVRWWF